MKVSAFLPIMVLSFSGSEAICAEEFPPCIPLNEELSVCTDIEGLGVSFIDATPTAALGSVRLQATDGINIVWAAYWEVDTPLEKYANEEALAAAEYEAEYELQTPVSLVIEGFPGVRYDLISTSQGEADLPPRSILFLDTGAGYTILNGFARDPSVELEDIHLAVKSSARIFQISE